MTMRALFVGDATLDLTCVLDHVPAPDEKVHVTTSFEAAGGVIANAAVACARVGTDVELVCHLGSDSTGEIVLHALQQEGIEVSATCVPGRTARVIILLEAHGEKRLILEPGDAFFPSSETLAGVNLAEVTWMHTAVYDHCVHSLVERCRAQNIPWSFDLEPATLDKGLEILHPALEGAELVFCNNRAAAILGSNAVPLLHSLGVRHVVRTCGAAGVEYSSRRTTYRARSNRPADILDTTGAGDCLAGWLIGERLAGASIEHQLQRATAAATQSCASFGAQRAYPTATRLEVSGIGVECTSHATQTHLFAQKNSPTPQESR